MPMSDSTCPNPSPDAIQDPWRPHPATIRRIVREIDHHASSVFTLELELDPAPYADAYRFLPGQFNMLYLPGAGEVAISHSGPTGGSIANQLAPGSFLHTIRSVGRVTRAIEMLQVGQRLGVRGPYGNPWPDSELESKDVLIVSGGLGMAPLRPVIYSIQSQRHRYRNVNLVYGSRSPDLILYKAELKHWAASDIRIEATVDRTDANVSNSWSGPIGPVTLLIDRRQSKSAYPDFDPLQTAVLICGPEVMMHYSALSALKLGVPPSAIWISMERNMQCGVGYCGHCQWGPFFLCKDGPVLRYDQASAYLNIKDL